MMEYGGDLNPETTAGDRNQSEQKISPQQTNGNPPPSPPLNSSQVSLIL